MAMRNEHGKVGFRSLYHELRTVADDRPEAVFVQTENERLTYAEACREAASLVYGFKHVYGISENDCVFMSAANSADAAVVIVAAYAVGAKLILLPETMGLATAKVALEDFTPDLVICGDAARLCFSGECGIDCPIVSIDELVAVSRAQGSDVSEVAFDAEGAPIILYSSGSTARPKAIINSCLRFAANMDALCFRLGIGARDVIYAPTPFDHCFGIGGLFCAILRGASLVTCGRYTAASSLDLVTRCRPTVSLCVPTMIQRECLAFDPDVHDLSSLRVCVIGGAPSGLDAMRTFERLSGCTIVQSYGMTETAGGVTTGVLEDCDDRRMATVGLPLEGVEMRIDDAIGEILVKSRAMAIGYISAGVFYTFPMADGGWFKSGDVGRFDADGRLVVTGRIKNIIIRGGVNILPGEIEAFYGSLDGIIECHVLGYPDVSLGERTCLCYTATDTFEVDPCDMRDLAKGSLEKCKLPDFALRLSDFPRLQNGKTDMKTLQSLVEKSVDSSTHFISMEGSDAS